MAENNGEVSKKNKDIKHEPDSNVERTEDYAKLIDYGLDKTVAEKLDEIYKTGKLAHEDLDGRALDALREFPVDGALSILTQFHESHLEHVSNKSAYLCGLMKTYRQRSRGGTSSGIRGNAWTNGPRGSVPKGPDEEKIKSNLQQELEELKEKLQSLSDIFKCPVCWEVLDKENISCVNGHSVCTKCIGIHQVCPSCRGNFSNLQQNAMVRQVLGVLSRKCKFCPEMLHPADDEHEKYCVLRPTFCQDSLCRWKGPVIELATHLKDNHNKLVFPESNYHVWHSNYDPNKKNTIVTLYSAFGHFLWQIRDNDPVLGLLTYTYIPVLVEKPSHDIWVERILESEKMTYNIAMKINLNEDVDHFTENSTLIPIVMLNSFIKKRCLYFSLFIKKENDS